jgi:hypothetical protein
MKKLPSITGTMIHKYHEPYNGEQTIDVFEDTDGYISISGVFGYSKDYPTFEAAIADIQHRHGFTFKKTNSGQQKPTGKIGKIALFF